nr:hypothetical protein BaRGS_006398 [Batillaria attramentaria]
MSWPYGPMPEDFQMKMIQSYSAATSYTDAQLGRVLEALDKAGFANNTIISFHGDHGWSLGEHEEWCKHSNFEIARRIPLMFYIPGVTHQTSSSESGETFPFIDALQTLNDDKPSKGENLQDPTEEKNEGRGMTADALVEAVDIYPTLCELAGLEMPPICSPDDLNVAFCTEGLSLVPVIRNVTHPSPGTHWKRAVFSQYPRPSYFPQNNTDNPLLADIRIMGYVIQTYMQV